MAQIEGILKISDDEVNGEVNVATSSMYGNNISSSPYSYDILDFINNMTVDNKSYSGAIVKTIGTTPTISQLRFGATLVDGTKEATYRGMLLGNSDSSKNYTLTLSLTGTKIIGIEIYFDSYTNQYPTEYTYNHTDLEQPVNVTNNTSNKIVINNMPAISSVVTFSITFTKWNLANTPIGITFIDFPKQTTTLTKAQIISFESQSQIVTSTSGVNYGVVATTGKININDNKKALYEEARLGRLNAYLFTLELLVNGKAIQKHISTESPLYTNDSKLELDLTDVLATWDNIVVPEQPFTMGQNLYDVVTYLGTYYSGLGINTMCSDTIVVGNYQGDLGSRYEETISMYLQKLKFTQNTTLKEGTLREQFEKICTCAQLMVYINRNNEIKFTSLRPIYMYAFNSANKMIEIPFTKQYSKPSYDILLSNKYEEVDIR